MGQDCAAGWSCTRDVVPRHLTGVSDFYLDLYEVTVARFRRFVAAYDGTPPKPGIGAHRRILGSGWDHAWDSSLPKDSAALRRELVKSYGDGGAFCTWTDSPGLDELKPINCVDWYISFYFCIWDGGRLPTEAEWEYAAVGGAQQRNYPWGEEPKGRARLSHGCWLDGNAACSQSDVLPVGSFTGDAARWGQRDLGGGLLEWVLDWFDDRYYERKADNCNDCAMVTVGTGSRSSSRVIRGGAGPFTAGPIVMTMRGHAPPEFRSDSRGIRCARDR